MVLSRCWPHATAIIWVAFIFNHVTDMGCVKPDIIGRRADGTKPAVYISLVF